MISKKVLDWKSKMSDFTSDSLFLREDFITKSEFWVKSAYNELITKITLVPNLQRFIQITLYDLIDEWNISIVPFLFDEFVKIVIKFKPERAAPLYRLGELYRGFDNIFSFQIQQETFEYLRVKLVENIVDANWLDIPFLSNYYRVLPRRKKILRFHIRSLILLAIRNKNRKIKDIRLKFKLN